MIKDNSHPPFSIVLTGGGMRCSWSGGFLVGLKDLGLVPKTIIAKSGNAGNAVYIATNQSDQIKRIWVEHLSGNRFINFLRFKKIIDIDFLVDEVLVEKEPLDFNALKSSPVKVFVACFNLTKQKMEYFSNNEITFPILKAAKALPFVYGKQISINNNKYADKTYLAEEILEDMKKNIEKKVLFIDVTERNPYFKILYRLLEGKTKLRKETFEKMFVIEPKRLHAHLLTRSKKVLEKSFDQGYHYAISHEMAIREYLNK